MRGDQSETFKIINGIFNYGGSFFKISPQTGNLLSRQILKTKSTNKLDIFLQIGQFIFGTNCSIKSKTTIM